MTVVACLCTWAQRYLYADGSHFLICMLKDRKVMDFDPPRRFTHYLMEYPAVFLARDLECRNPLLIGSVYGFTLFLAPILALALTWWAARNAPVRYWVYPLLSQAIVWLTMSFVPLDIHVAVWLFWCLLYLLNFTKKFSIPVAVLTIGLAVLSTCAYQVYLFLAWPLIVSAGVRCKRAWTDRQYFDVATSCVCLSLHLLSFAIALKWSLFPVDPNNRANFALSMLSHLANPPVWYSLLVLVCAVWLTQWPDRRRGWMTIWRATCVCGLLVAILPLIGFVMPPLQHMARVQGLYVPLILSGLVLLQRYIYQSNSWSSQQQQKDFAKLVAWTCVVAVCFQSGATYQWNRYRQKFLGELAEHRGVVRYEEFDLSSPDLERFVDSSDYRSAWFRKVNDSPVQALGQLYYSQFNLGFSWTMPSMSITLSVLNLGKVTTIVSAPDNVEWQPFDPWNPAAIPDFSDYGVSTSLDTKSSLASDASSP